MSVAVVVDGGASLPAGPLGAACRQVPMRLEPSSGAGAGTAAPAPGAFLEAIEEADTGDGVVVVTVAERLSASGAAARTAARLAAPGTVEVVDSRSATAGQGLVALAAARAAAQGLALPAVAAAAHAAAQEVRLVAQIGRLDALVRGGRLPAGVARATRRAGMRVLFELRDGRIRPLRPALGLASAEARLVTAVRAGVAPGRPVELGALHAGAADSADRLLGAVSASVAVVEAFVSELSPPMLAHTGPGVSGLAWRVPGEAVTIGARSAVGERRP